MPQPRRGLFGRTLLVSSILLILVALLGVIGFSQAAAAQDWGRHGGGRLCAGAARIAVGAESLLDSTLGDLVAEGTLTQEQAAAVTSALADRGEFANTSGPGRPAARCANTIASIRSTIVAVTDLLGIDAAGIRSRVQSGETLLEIAESVGVSRDDLIAALQTGLNERLDRAVANGRITTTERAEIENASYDRISRILDGIQDRREDAPSSSTPSTTSATFVLH